MGYDVGKKVKGRKLRQLIRTTSEPTWGVELQKPRLKLGLVEEARHHPAAHEQLTARQLFNLSSRSSGRCPIDARLTVSLQGYRNLLPVAKPANGLSRAISTHARSAANPKLTIRLFSEVYKLASRLSDRDKGPNAYSRRSIRGALR